MDSRCIFCNKIEETNGGESPSSVILFTFDSFIVGLDAFPVTDGHCLIIPKRHIQKITELTEEEFSELYHIFKTLEETYHTDYNIGINCGKAAGQTINHLHIHFIPRHEGDCENPRGGVRGVIPSKQQY